MAERDLDIVALGEPMIEFNQTRAGEPQFVMGHGGDTSNCAVAVARAGGRVGYVTRLGTDPFGTSLIELWQREHIDIAAVTRDPDAPTGVYFVTHSTAGHEFRYYRRGSAASRMTPAWVPHDYIARAHILYVSGISFAISTTACDAVLAAIESAAAAGVTVALDTNLRLGLWPLARARAVLAEAARTARIVRPSIDDARLLTGVDHPDAIVDHFLRGGAAVVALTLGSDGALVATSEDRRRFAAHALKSCDATGAGDTFSGAFLTEYRRTGDPFAAGRFANAAAALATTGFGAVAPMPQRRDVELFLATAA